MQLGTSSIHEVLVGDWMVIVADMLAAWQPPETSDEEEGTIDTIVSALLHARLPK